MVVHASAPCPLLEIGTWTDTAFAEFGAVLSCCAAADTHITLTPREDPGVLLSARETIPSPLEEFLHVAARYFRLDHLHAQCTEDDVCALLDPFPARAVAITGALAHWAGVFMPPPQVAALAHYLCCDELRCPSGTQRFVAAALGGIVLTEIRPYPRSFPAPVAQTPEQYLALERQLLLIGTGRAARTDGYRYVERRFRARERKAREAVWALRPLPAQAADAIRVGDITAFGRILCRQAELHRQLWPGLISPEASHLEILLRQHGGLAMAVLPSGGTVLALCGDEQRGAIEAELAQAGYPVSPVTLDRYGLRVWRFDPEENRAPTELADGCEAA